MVTEAFPLNAVLDTCCQLQFGIGDLIRRAQGHAFGAIGLDPIESPYSVIFSGPFWRLRDYGEHDAAKPVLIVAAPIKRPYIWDLTPLSERYPLHFGTRPTCVSLGMASGLPDDRQEWIDRIRQGDFRVCRKNLKQKFSS